MKMFKPLSALLHERWFKVCCLVVLILLAVALIAEIVTYRMWAEGTEPLAVQPFFPQYVHFVEGTTFEFVCVDDDTLQSLSGKQIDTLVAELERHFGTVYLGESNIPADKIVRDREGRFAYVEDGFLLTFVILRRGPFWFKAHIADWEGGLAASSRHAVFVWGFNRWRQIWVSGTAIA